MSINYRNTIVAITGGTGSFGQTFAIRLLELGVKEVRIISRDEAKQDAMRHNSSDSRLRFYLGDVRQIQSLAHAFSGADVVFHAAALKQVPSCEYFPEQALQTNVIGSENVILQAHAESVKKVVFISTDKAVAPVNAMGMTKALMEKLVQSYARRLGDSDLKKFHNEYTYEDYLTNLEMIDHLFETYLMLREKLKQAQEVIAKLQKP